MSKKQVADFDSRIQGIPCGIVVGHYSYTAPSGRCAQRCETPEEYYGDEEFEFHVIDRKGYSAGWLEVKMDSSDEERIYEDFKESQADYCPH
ncbi:MAG: hypothetical protein DRH08_05810 [Deltaproteobacteria bacterium]|nr:MAG: hypothetical protein DRH08_05810 [Deltaproteobacteria bacterium]